MKTIQINKVKTVPKLLNKNFELCVFGEPEDDVKSWISENGFEKYQSGHYTNIKIPNEIYLSGIFSGYEPFAYMDGFSPNLNKKLHIGHFSNLVIAKALASLGVCKKTVSIYGDTLTGEISNELGLSFVRSWLDVFDFHPDKSFFASEMEYSGSLLKNGTGKYRGTKIFEVGEEKKVAVKSNGETSYLYQDAALAEKLNAPTLYVTGKEQCDHFAAFKKLFPHIEHIGLGLVKVSGKKMASRKDNVIFMDDFLKQIAKELGSDDFQLAYNVFAGFILKSSPSVDKNINIDFIKEPKNSAGLYISYTMARLNSAGLPLTHDSEFKSKTLEFTYLKSKFNLSPHFLFDALVEHCREINNLYAEHTIKDNPHNQAMFADLLSDLLYGCKLLGLFIVKKV